MIDRLEPAVLTLLVIAITIFLIVMAILWFFLPFAIFDIRRTLKETSGKIDRANDPLDELNRSFKDIAKSASDQTTDRR